MIQKQNIKTTNNDILHFILLLSFMLLLLVHPKFETLYHKISANIND